MPAASLPLAAVSPRSSTAKRALKVGMTIRMVRLVITAKRKVRITEATTWGR